RAKRPQQETRSRIAALEQARESLLADPALQPKPGRSRPHPHARGLALTGVVVLAALRDLIDVVAASARTSDELADRHHPAPQAAETAVWAIGSRRISKVLPRRQTASAESEHMRCRRTSPAPRPPRSRQTTQIRAG